MAQIALTIFSLFNCGYGRHSIASQTAPRGKVLMETLPG